MKKTLKLLVKLHKVLGIALCIPFCIWFLSGTVLIYKGFPHFSQADSYRLLAKIESSSLKEIQTPAKLPKGKVSLEMQDGKLVYKVGKGDKAAQLFEANTLAKLSKPTRQQCINNALKLVQNSDTLRVELKTKLDIWTPWEQYRASLPFYKVYLNDTERTEAYISAKNGAIVQASTRAERVYAAIGAIPHYIIFKYLSLESPLWNIILITLLLIGAAMSIFGIVVGLVRIPQRGKGMSPYKNGWLRWHHIVGIVFGLFTVTFCLSAYVGVNGVPQWVAHDSSEVDYLKEWSKPIKDRERYQKCLPLLCNYVNYSEGTKRIALTSCLGEPAFVVYQNKLDEPKTLTVDSDSLVEVSKIEIEKIASYAKKQFGDTIVKSAEEIRSYDSYYQKTRMGSRPLPAYKITINDTDGTWLYVSPKTGEIVTTSTKEKRAERWLYRGMHTFNIQWLKEHEWLRKILLLVVCLGGFVVSITGTMLAIRWLVRKKTKIIRTNKK
jgi:ribosome-associated translation inhibitor RaiA